VILEGVIESFDDARGDGTLRSDEHGVFYFHCVEILDGTRNVDVGARVRARRVVGRLGRDEAGRIQKIAAS
jgi:cold shock CspA family protein